MTARLPLRRGFATLLLAIAVLRLVAGGLPASSGLGQPSGGPMACAHDGHSAPSAPRPSAPGHDHCSDCCCPAPSDVALLPPVSMRAAPALVASINRAAFDPRQARPVAAPARHRQPPSTAPPIA